MSVDGQPLTDGPLLEEIQLVLGGGSLANDATTRLEDGEWIITGDPTEAAFLVAEAKLGISDLRRARSGVSPTCPLHLSANL